MSQKYLPQYSGTRYIVGPHALRERPKLESLIGKCISTWSYVDNEIGGLFGLLLTTESAAALQVFLILRRSGSQREALDVAANGKLSIDETAVYKALRMEYKALENERNLLAHSCFGACPDDDNLLFAINVRDHVKWQAKVLPKLANGYSGDDSHAGLKEDMYVYKLSDLEALHRRMDQLWWNVFHFNGYLRESNNPLRVTEFQKLPRNSAIIS